MKNTESGEAVATDIGVGHDHSQWIAGMELCHAWSRQVWGTYCSRKACREEPWVVGQLELTMCVFWPAPDSAVIWTQVTMCCVTQSQDHSWNPHGSTDMALAYYQTWFSGMPFPSLTIHYNKRLCWICCTYFQVSFILGNIFELLCIHSQWLSLSLTHTYPFLLTCTHMHTYFYACSLDTNIMCWCCGSK